MLYCICQIRGVWSIWGVLHSARIRCDSCMNFLISHGSSPRNNSMLFTAKLSAQKKIWTRVFDPISRLLFDKSNKRAFSSGLKSFSDVHYNGVVTVSKVDKMIGLFCRILSLLYGSFAKESYNCIDRTNISHPIAHEPGSMSDSCHKYSTTYITHHI